MNFIPQMGAGGGCVEISSGTFIYHEGSPNTSIATAAVKTALRLASSPGSGRRSGGGNGSGGIVPPPSQTCDVFIGVVTQAPVNGVGAGVINKVNLRSDGTYTGGGGTVAVIFPRI